MSTPCAILQVAIPSPLWKTFDYLPLHDQPLALRPGIRLRVPFGRREVIGFLMRTVSQSTIPVERLKRVLAVLDVEPLIPKLLLQFYQFSSTYYHYPLGATIAVAVPALLRKGRAEIPTLVSALKQVKDSDEKDPRPLLNQDQQYAVDQVTGHFNFKTFVLWGITGSGKTEVYLRCVEQVMARRQQVLLLIPEIGLTSQILRRFQARFSVPIVIMNSRVSDKKRMQAWLMSKQGEAAIIIGTRSAIFMPFAHLGMIIVDEEHDMSFKQQSGLRYSARDLAVFRGNLDNIPVVLGSATPSLETLYNVERERYQVLNLPTRAGVAALPTIDILDLREQTLASGMSEALMEAIEAELKAGGQVLLFLNRRGYAPTLLCHGCGFILYCDDCDARLILHDHIQRLRCHHCGIQRKIPACCSKCGYTTLIPLGVGTEQLEATLMDRFPDYQVDRIDRDSTHRQNSMDVKIERILSHKTHIVVGTQMIAKGHHFPDLSLVAILDADSGLYGSDFRSIERMGQLLQQVAGRAGRALKPGRVLIQTHYPTHPLWQRLMHAGYAEFAHELLQERKMAGWPPFSHLALIYARSMKQNKSHDFLMQVKDFIVSQNHADVELLGPIPAMLKRKAKYYRDQLLLQASHRDHLHYLLDRLTDFLSTQPSPSIRWGIDVDPQDHV